QGPSDTVEKYATKLRELHQRVDPTNTLPEQAKIANFKRGLQTNIKLFVTMSNFTSLEEITEKAKQVEAALKQSIDTKVVMMSTAGANTTPTPITFTQEELLEEVQLMREKLSLLSQTNNQATTSDSKPRSNQNITCYNCGRKGHRKAECRSKARSSNNAKYCEFYKSKSHNTADCRSKPANWKADNTKTGMFGRKQPDRTEQSWRKVEKQVEPEEEIKSKPEPEIQPPPPVTHLEYQLHLDEDNSDLTALCCSATVNKKQINLILDTGASGSIVTKQFLDESNIKPQWPSTVRITNINGETYIPLGAIDNFPVTVGTLTVP